MALVYPNTDPGMFWVAFYGCLLAEVIPVPIEVPLSRQVRSKQLLFLGDHASAAKEEREQCFIICSYCCKWAYLVDFKIL